MSFDWDIRHFPNADSFRQYLATLPRPVWCTGMTVHHTVIPTVATWRGRESMDALGRFYRDDVQNPDGSKGWSAGPQLFIGPDGIWQGTPVHHRGVHAGVCNSTRIGIEVVGDYDNTGWQPPIKGYVYDALTLLCQWLGVESPRINGHRDCNSPKNCPGRAIDLDLVRLQVQTLLSPAPLRDMRVIGVSDAEQSVLLLQFGRACERNAVQLSGSEIGRFYRLCCEENMDAGVLLAMTKHEGDFGRSPLQQRTNNALNIKTTIDDPRAMTYYDAITNVRWYRFESWRLGLIYGMYHLKNEYGAARHLQTLREIIPVFAPLKDGNIPERYIAAVLEDVAYMRTH